MRICLIFIGIALASCAPSTQYIRANGQSISQQQIESDRAACSAEHDDHFCMVGKGYFLVSEEQAAAKSAELAAIADEERKQAELAAQADAKAKQQARAKTKRKQTAATPN